MKSKTTIATAVAVIFAFVVLAPEAQAGNVQRNRWEGIAIGLGAAILGSAILGQYRLDHSREPVQATVSDLRRELPKYREPVYYRTPDPESKHHRHRYIRADHPKRHRCKGKWEMRKEWVPPTYKRVWNPGHYNRRGKWVPGHWIEIEDTPGYWIKTRVWVARR